MKLIIAIICCFLVGCASQIPAPKTNYPAQEIKYQFYFKKKHQLSIDAAMKKSEDLANSLKKHGLVWEWKNNSIIFDVRSGLVSGSNGVLTVLPNEIDLNIKGVPDHLLIFESIIKDKVNSRLDYYFK